MCWDIDVTKHTLEELRVYRDRFTYLLNQPELFRRFQEDGHAHQLLQAKKKVVDAIAFRENLLKTSKSVFKKRVRSNSETDVKDADSVRRCFLDKLLPVPRMVPNLKRKHESFKRSASMEDIEPKTKKLMSLIKSLSMPQEQEISQTVEITDSAMEDVQMKLNKSEEMSVDEDNGEPPIETIEVCPGIVDETMPTKMEESSVIDYRHSRPGPSGLNVPKRRRGVFQRNMFYDRFCTRKESDSDDSDDD